MFKKRKQTKEVTLSTPEQIQAKEDKLFLSWRFDPEKFVKEALGVEEITTQQKGALSEIRQIVTAKFRRYKGAELTEAETVYANKIGISIMSGRGTGKDTTASWAILWFLFCWRNSLIPATANSAKQLRDILWREVNKWLSRSPIKDAITWQSDKIYMNEKQGREWFAVARTYNPQASDEDQAETLSGFHEDNMMFVIDEGSAIKDAVFSPLEGSLTGPVNFVLLLFNPTRSTGFAKESHFKDRSRWICLRWNAEESERVEKSHIERLEKKYGRNSSKFRIDVLGLPPLTDSNLLIPYDWVMEAVNRDIEPDDSDPYIFGFDVGAGSDSSVLLPRRGPKVEPLMQNDTPDSEALTGWAVRKIFDYEPSHVMVDVIGVGWAISGNLRSRTQANIVSVNVAEAASVSDRFCKLRDELWWSLRERFERKEISIPDDDELIGELTTIRFEEMPNGKIKIESKKDMKKRGIESPNKADALCLTEFLSMDYIKKSAQNKKNKKKLKRAGWKTV